MIINAAKHTVGYIALNKNENYLDKLDPDLVIAIKAMSQELNMTL
ncbi:MAG: hypothetical protein R2771_12405 [Saprospiraceae bacterium]